MLASSLEVRVQPKLMAHFAQGLLTRSKRRACIAVVTLQMYYVS